jgi:GGDEF domain-containing protein
MLDRLESAIATARRRETRIAVLFIDPRPFQAHQRYARHAIGDEALKADRTAPAIRRARFRHGQPPWRRGVPGAAARTYRRRPTPVSIAQKLLAALAAPARAGEHSLHLSASIGITIYPRTPRTRRR